MNIKSSPNAKKSPNLVTLFPVPRFSNSEAMFWPKMHSSVYFSIQRAVWELFDIIFWLCSLGVHCFCSPAPLITLCLYHLNNPDLLHCLYSQRINLGGEAKMGDSSGVLQADMICVSQQRHHHHHYHLHHQLVVMVEVFFCHCTCICVAVAL